MLACFDIGGSLVKAAFARTPGDIEPAGSLPTPVDDFGAFTAAIGALIGTSAHLVKGVAISTTGVVDPSSGKMNCANIPCIHGRPLAADLSKALGLPVFIANDADCFALAEALQGAGRGHRNVFGIILGTGVGGGLVFDGRIVTGAGGYAGEWGHGTALQTRAGNPAIDIPHFSCGCGRSGCVDTVGGARGMERLFKTLTGKAATSFDIVQSWQSGEADASRVIDVYLDLVSTVLALALNITGATIVPVGGGLSNSTELISALDTRVGSKMLYKSPTPLLVPAQLTVNPAFAGAALLGFQELGRG